MKRFARYPNRLECSAPLRSATAAGVLALLAALFSSRPAGAQPSGDPGPASPAGSVSASLAELRQWQRLWLQAALLAGSPRSGTVTPQQERDALDAYFTNGGEATAVPTEGPGAQYFQNGAEVLAAPTSVIPELAFGTGAEPSAESASPPATAAPAIPTTSAPSGGGNTSPTAPAIPTAAPAQSGGTEAPAAPAAPASSSNASGGTEAPAPAGPYSLAPGGETGRAAAPPASSSTASGGTEAPAAPAAPSSSAPGGETEVRPTSPGSSPTAGLGTEAAAPAPPPIAGGLLAASAWGSEIPWAVPAAQVEFIAPTVPAATASSTGQAAPGVGVTAPMPSSTGAMPGGAPAASFPSAAAPRVLAPIVLPIELVPPPGANVPAAAGARGVGLILTFFLGTCLGALLVAAGIRVRESRPTRVKTSGERGYRSPLQESPKAGT